MLPSEINQVLDDLVPRVRDRRSTSRAVRLNQTLSVLGSALKERASSRHARISRGISTLIELHDQAVDRRQQAHAATSPDLNCWAILGLEHSELDHCRVLAWLFDRRQAHGQGDLFLRCLLDELRYEFSVPVECASEPYRVATEVRHDQSRIDIEVVGQTFILHIEAKVHAEEGDDQTLRECEDLKKKAAARRISAERARGVYLTTDGSQCKDREKFHPVSWSKVLVALDRARAQILVTHPQNRYLPWVLESYIATVRRHVLKERSR